MRAAIDKATLAATQKWGALAPREKALGALIAIAAVLLLSDFLVWRPATKESNAIAIERAQLNDELSGLGVKKAQAIAESKEQRESSIAVKLAAAKQKQANLNSVLAKAGILIDGKSPSKVIADIEAVVGMPKVEVAFSAGQPSKDLPGLFERQVFVKVVGGWDQVRGVPERIKGLRYLGAPVSMRATLTPEGHVVELEHKILGSSERWVMGGAK